MKKIYILSGVAIFAVALAGIASAGFGGFGHGPLEATGLTQEEIMAKIDSGMTMPEIMKEAGINIEEMHALRQEEMKEKLAEMVADGKITQERADEKIARMEEMNQKFLSGEIPGKSGRPRGFGGFMMGNNK